MRLGPALLLIGAAFAGLAFALSMLGTDPGVCETYHEMREIYENTNSEYGWPKGAVEGCENED